MRGVTFKNQISFKADGISTHTPHARRDKMVSLEFVKSGIFLLTRLMRGVTCFSVPFNGFL